MAGRSLIEMAGGYAPHTATPPIVDTLSLEDERPCARVTKIQVLDDDSLIHRVTYATVAGGELLLFDIEHPNPARNAANLTEFEALVGEIAKEVTADGIRWVLSATRGGMGTDPGRRENRSDGVERHRTDPEKVECIAQAHDADSHGSLRFACPVRKAGWTRLIHSTLDSVCRTDVDHLMPIYEKSETLDAVSTRLASGSLITSNDSETVFSRQWFADVSGRGTLAEEHGRSSNVLIGGGSARLLFTGTMLQNRDLDPLVTEALFDLFHAMIATFERVPPETPETGAESAEY